MRQLKLGSLFDGIGGWQVAALHSGVLPVWSSEIEEFPMEVTKQRFPNTKQLGDVRNVNGAEIEPVDIICAGSPCQDLSRAGKMEGLKGARSRLFEESVRVVREMQESTNGRYPRYFVWENVPGAFSSNQGRDFRTVLQEITQTDIPIPGSGRWADAGLVGTKRCEVAWRTLDAKYWGVPQRRKRVFLVASFASDSAGKILFERKRIKGSFAEYQKERKNRSATIVSSLDKKSKRGLTAFDNHARLARYSEMQGVSPTVLAYWGTGGNNVPFVVHENVEDPPLIRKFTPLECERLQGLPDGYTKLKHRQSDGERYKALGNGMAQPCADFVIRRIAEVNRVSDDTMGNDNE